MTLKYKTSTSQRQASGPRKRARGLLIAGGMLALTGVLITLIVRLLEVETPRRPPPEKRRPFIPPGTSAPSAVELPAPRGAAISVAAAPRSAAAAAAIDQVIAASTLAVVGEEAAVPVATRAVRELTPAQLAALERAERRRRLEEARIERAGKVVEARRRAAASYERLAANALDLAQKILAKGAKRPEAVPGLYERVGDTYGKAAVQLAKAALRCDQAYRRSPRGQAAQSDLLRRQELARRGVEASDTAAGYYEQAAAAYENLDASGSAAKAWDKAAEVHAKVAAELDKIID